VHLTGMLLKSVRLQSTPEIAHRRSWWAWHYRSCVWVSGKGHLQALSWPWLNLLRPDRAPLDPFIHCDANGLELCNTRWYIHVCLHVLSAGMTPIYGCA